MVLLVILIGAILGMESNSDSPILACWLAGVHLRIYKD